jgi:hypothetical protein
VHPDHVVHTNVLRRFGWRGFATGCHGYISKPINVKTFVAEIETIQHGRI